jgi:rhamnosyltransferase
MRITDPARYRNDIPYRQQLHFFSDCNACIRRSVWSLYHYPEVDFGEDQAWAERILLAGFAKAYADEAVVLHSHELGIGETLRRAYDESAAYRRLFTYNLCPSPGVLFRQSWNLIRGDLRYARHARLFTRAPVWTFKAPWLDLARMTGYYLGSREQSLPRWLRARLSGDQIKKRT